MRILIVTHYFPPINNIASSRPYYWSKYWVEAGHDVRVLTTFKTPKDGPLDYSPENLSELNVKQLAHWPYAVRPKRHNPSALKPHTRSSVDSVSLSQKYLKILSDIRKSLLPLPLHKVWWIKPAVQYALDLHKSWPYDIVISIFSPLATHIVASVLKKHLDIIWVADYRDSLTGNHFKNAPFPFAQLISMAEKHFLLRADLISTVSDPIKEKLGAFFKKTAITIENGFDPSEYRVNNGRYFPDNDKIRLIYTGTIYPRKQDPSPLFRAIKMLKNETTAACRRLDVLFYCRSSDPQYLQGLIAKYDLSDCIEVNEFVDRNTSLQVQREADALIFLDWNDKRESGVLTGKIFEYIYSGTPILSIGGSEKSVASQVIKESGTGVILQSNVDQIQTAIQKIIDKQNSAYHPSDTFLQKYHKKQLAEKYLNQICRLAGGHVTAGLPDKH